VGLLVQRKLLLISEQRSRGQASQSMVGCDVLVGHPPALAQGREMCSVSPWPRVPDSSGPTVDI
ncbi:hypothetical protein KI387_003281, partial [Taxus chinensis]